MTVEKLAEYSKSVPYTAKDALEAAIEVNPHNVIVICIDKDEDKTYLVGSNDKPMSWTEVHWHASQLCRDILCGKLSTVIKAP